jgi:hypothetical protein
MKIVVIGSIGLIGSKTVAEGALGEGRPVTTRAG